MKNKLILVVFGIFLFLSINLVLSIDWLVQTPYDDFTDGTINDSLWINGTDTTGYESETGGKFKVWSDHNGRFKSKNSTSLPDYHGIENITIQATVFADGVDIDPATATIRYGNEVLITVSDIEAGTDSDTTKWVLIKNHSNGNFTVYNDGTWNNSINPTGSSIYLYTSCDNDVGSDSYIELDFVRYTLNNGTLNITLNNPSANENMYYFNDVDFNITTDTSVNNLTNITLYINDVLNETIIISGTNNETEFTKNMSSYPIDDYNYSVQVCDTDDNCLDSETIIFHLSPFNENSQKYNTTTTEGNLQPFELNLTYDNVNFDNLNARLNYNGTSYSSTKSASGNEAIFTRSISVPKVSANTDYDFYWEITLSNGTQFNYNSTTNSQTVNNLGIDGCTSYSVIFMNMSLYHEETKALLDGNDTNSSVHVDINLYSIGDRSSAVISYSGNFSRNESQKVCLQNDLSNSTYEMEASIRYMADGYEKEFYNFQNTTLINSSLPVSTSLYILESSSTVKTFLVTFKDENFLPVQDALIQVQRRYISDGVFRTVEAPLTDDNGQTKVHLDTQGATYTFIVSKNGEVLATFNNTAAICQDIVIDECNINLNIIGSGVSFEDWYKIGGISYSMSFNPSTRIVTALFTTNDGSSKTILLNTTKYDRFGNDTVCTDTLTSSSGTLTCTVPAGYGNVTIISQLVADGTLVGQNIFTIVPDADAIFGRDAAAFILIMLLTIPLLFLPSTIFMIFGVIIGMIMAALLNLYNYGSWLAVGSTITYAIIAGSIIIWKIASREY